MRKAFILLFCAAIVAGCLWCTSATAEETMPSPAAAPVKEECRDERRTGENVFVCDGKVVKYITLRNGQTYRVTVEERSTAQIEAMYRDQDAYDDRRETKRAMDKIMVQAADDAREHERDVNRTELRLYEREREESFRYAGRWYRRESSNPYYRSSGAYAAFQQKHGACASIYKDRYAACR
jgi:hypothetical protein